MKSNFAKKQITMLTLVLALAVAVYLNWRFANGGNVLPLTESLTDNSAAQQVNADAEGTAQESSEISSGAVLPQDAQQTTGETYYGDALFVSKDESSAESYFSEARMTRTSTRDEALDALQKSLQKTDLTEAERRISRNNSLQLRRTSPRRARSRAL
ncbi:MAG: SpoIIIAH-like family protein [Oscillospiraceae bacterium]|nr:SpoIIIAH-like family protein [Oscillospiraceae bacterium]